MNSALGSPTPTQMLLFEHRFKLVYERPYTAIPVQPSKPWHSAVGPSIRNQLLLKLVETSCFYDKGIIRETKFASYIELAQNEERDCYVTADTAEIYYNSVYGKCCKAAGSEGVEKPLSKSSFDIGTESSGNKTAQKYASLFTDYFGKCSKGYRRAYDRHMDVMTANAGPPAVMAKYIKRDSKSCHATHLIEVNRNVMVFDLLQAIIPGTTQQQLHVEKVKEVVEYARYMEAEVYKWAETEKDYTQTMQLVLRQIRETSVNDEKETTAMKVEEKKDWQENVIKDHREHLIGKLINVIMINPAHVSELERRNLVLASQLIMNRINAHARKLECKCYLAANSRREYYELIAREMGEVMERNAYASKSGWDNRHKMNDEYMQNLTKKFNDVTRQMGKIDIGGGSVDKNEQKQQVRDEETKENYSIVIFGKSYEIEPLQAIRGSEKWHKEIDRQASLKLLSSSFYPDQSIPSPPEEEILNKITTIKEHEANQLDRSNSPKDYNYWMTRSCKIIKTIRLKLLVKPMTTAAVTAVVEPKPLSSLPRPFLSHANMVRVFKDVEEPAASAAVGVKKIVTEPVKVMKVKKPIYENAEMMKKQQQPTQEENKEVEKIISSPEDSIKSWHRSVSFAQRSNIVDDLVKISFSTKELEAMTKEQKKGVVEYAQSVELDCFLVADTWQEYMRLLSDKTCVVAKEFKNKISKQAVVASGEMEIPPFAATPTVEETLAEVHYKAEKDVSDLPAARVREETRADVDSVETMGIPEVKPVPSSFTTKFEHVTPKATQVDKDWCLPSQRENIVELRKFFLDKFLMTKFTFPNDPVPEEEKQSVIEAMQNEELECYENSNSMNNYIMTTVLKISETYNKLSEACKNAAQQKDDDEDDEDDEESTASENSDSISDDSRSTTTNTDDDDWSLLEDSLSSSSSSNLSYSCSSAFCSSSEELDEEDEADDF